MTLQQEYDSIVNEANACKIDMQITMRAMREEFLEYVHAAVKKTGMQDKIAFSYIILDEDVDSIDELKHFAEIYDGDSIDSLRIAFTLMGDDEYMTLHVPVCLRVRVCLNNDKLSLVPIADVDNISTNGSDKYEVMFKFMGKFVSQLDMIAKHVNSKKFMSMLSVVIDYARLCAKAKDIKCQLISASVNSIKRGDVIHMMNNAIEVVRVTPKRIYFKDSHDNEQYIKKELLIKKLYKNRWRIEHRA